MVVEVVSNSTAVANSKLKQLFIDQLRDTYWAEKKLVKALGKMEEAATTLRLREAFRTHQEETRVHVDRLEKVFKSINEIADDTKCPAMAGIIDEAHDIIDDTDSGTSQRDAGLIIAAQKAEHYEIATYGSLAQLAEILGYTEAKNILGQTLEEEKITDTLLTDIARSGINYSASLEPEDEIVL
ncbi:MAG TPA: ferritin-like domain-containing protein [Flavisolibacter sp.]|nr:ferritin-like domain-containing protein [Flavisolibacter sp.]